MLTDVRPLFTIHDQYDGPASVTLLMTLDAIKTYIGEYDTVDEAVLALKAVKNALGAIERFNAYTEDVVPAQGVGSYGDGPGVCHGAKGMGAGWAMASFLDGVDVEPHPIADTHHLGHPANQGPGMPRDPAAYPLKQPPADGPLLSGGWGSTTQDSGVRSGNESDYTPGELECLRRHVAAGDAFAPHGWLLTIRYPTEYAQYVAGEMSLDALKQRVGQLTAPSSFIGEAWVEGHTTANINPDTTIAGAAVPPAAHRSSDHLVP